jgi:hypothetical protein
MHIKKDKMKFHHLIHKKDEREIFIFQFRKDTKEGSFKSVPKLRRIRNILISI